VEKQQRLRVPKKKNWLKMLRFCSMSLIVSGIVFLIFRRKKSAPIWFDLVVVFAGAFKAKER